MRDILQIIAKCKTLACYRVRREAIVSVSLFVNKLSHSVGRLGMTPEGIHFWVIIGENCCHGD